METNMLNNELEQLREQMQVLREKLDKQHIINDRMVKRSVRSKMSWIKIYVYVEFLVLPFLALIWWVMKDMFALSWFCYAFLMVMSTIDVIWDYRINITSLNLDKVEDNSLMDTLHKLTTMKKMRAKSFFIMMPLVVLWLVWVGVEMWQHLGTVGESGGVAEATAYGGFAGLIIGIPLGLFVAIRIYCKMQRTNDELIAQIQDFSDNE